MKKLSFILSAMLFLAVACQEKPEEQQVVASLEVNPVEIAAPADGNSTVVNVTANCDWKFVCADEWVTIDPAEGNGDTKVTVTVAANENTKERKSTINVNSSAKKVTIAVTQEAKEVEVPPVDTKITAIKTAEDFAAFAATATSYEPTETVTLEADITIAAPADSIICNFDGKNHTITLADHNDEGLANIGVFRVVHGAVKNLKVEGKITVAQGETSPCHVGGVAGLARSTASFENCTSNIAINLSNKVTHHVGGIVGYTEKGVSLTNCTNKGAITADYTALTSSNACQISGIVGHFEVTGSITGCVNDGSISYDGAGTGRVAGIVAYLNNIETVTIKDCTNNGSVDCKATNYTSTKWAYVGGITGYFGTPVVGAKVTIDGCTNNGAITGDGAGTKIRIRIAGINGHAGNSNVNADTEGKGVHTWELKGCANNGPITAKNVSNGRVFVGGLAPFSEPGGQYIFENCTNNAAVSSDLGTNYSCVGGILGGGGSVDCIFKNVIVTDKTVINLPEESSAALAGLIAGSNGAFNTEITGKVGAGKIVRGSVETVATADNFTTMLFGSALGADATITGVTFGN